jgi:plasmid stabilization system protein ParE
VSHSLRLTPDAVRDVDRALGYYASIRIELLIELQAELDEYFDRVAERPLSFQSHERSHVRRVFMETFPYGIFFIVEGDEVVVLAVFHVAGDPEDLSARLADAGEQGDRD